ncbi:unnamed protein product [Prorocentrum cordatum]|uniref:Uncharacterized protein n=1 Tax=Prorocentrum cordatum TaxID=2364126 RepID=A0ABN9TZ59_9DINO|nr:unnamed protein product [Polarella glacialis]
MRAQRARASEGARTMSHGSTAKAARDNQLTNPMVQSRRGRENEEVLPPMSWKCGEEHPVEAVSSPESRRQVAGGCKFALQKVKRPRLVPQHGRIKNMRQIEDTTRADLP